MKYKGTIYANNMIHSYAVILYKVYNMVPKIFHSKQQVYIINPIMSI